MHRQRKLGRYLRHAGNELVEGSPHLAHYRLNRRIVVRVDLYRLSEYGSDRYTVLIRFCREQACAAYALYDHSRAVLAETHELLYCTDAAYLANIVLYLLAVAVTVAQRAADSLLYISAFYILPFRISLTGGMRPISQNDSGDITRSVLAVYCMRRPAPDSGERTYTAVVRPAAAAAQHAAPPVSGQTSAYYR